AFVPTVGGRAEANVEMNLDAAGKNACATWLELRRDRLGFLLRRRLRFPHLLILLLEAVDAAFRVDQLLAPGEARVAARTEFHADIALMSGARTERMRAGADDVDLLVGWVNAGFHGDSPETCRLSLRHRLKF